MADLLHVIGEALSAYWLSPLPLTVLAVCISSIGTLLYVFVTNGRHPKLRVSLLTALYALSIFFWAFVATSLVLCASQARMVAYARNGVSLAVFGAVFAGLATTSIVSFLVWRYGNAAVIRKFAPRLPGTDESWLQPYVDLIGKFEGVPRVTVRIVESNDALAMAVGGRDQTILVSTALLALLERDEIEPVIVHELMHLKHHDTEFNGFCSCPKYWGKGQIRRTDHRNLRGRSATGVKLTRSRRVHLRKNLPRRRGSRWNLCKQSRKKSGNGFGSWSRPPRQMGAPFHWMNSGR